MLETVDGVDQILEIKKMIEIYTDVDLKDIQMSSELSCDLGLTSFDLMLLVGAVEEKFDITVDDAMMRRMLTVGSVYKELYG